MPVEVQRDNRDVTLILLKPWCSIRVHSQFHDTATFPLVVKPSTHFRGGCMGPRAGLEGYGEGKIS